MKAAEQYLPVVLFFVLYKLIHAFESSDQILKIDHSDEAADQFNLLVIMR